jgi:hypothetical protein
MAMHKSNLIYLLIALVSVGCEQDDNHEPISTCLDPDIEKTPLPDIPLVRKTEHLDFYSDGFVCAGTSLELERHITFVADSVGVDLRTNIPVVLSVDPPAQCESAA